MTVSSTNRKAGPYYGNGVTAAFPFSFKVFAASDLLVVKTNLTTGVDTVLAATDYSVSLTTDTTGGYSGGTVTLTAGALASTYTLTITSSILYTQNTDLTNTGGFYPKVINSALDRLTILCQQLLEQVSRSLKLSISTPPGVTPTLPAPVKNNMIAWNANGDGLQNLDPQALATIVAFGTANSDKFSGDGTTTQFALSNNPGALNNLDVSIGGVTQRPGIDYNWSAGTVITFTTAPATGTNNILVRYMQGLPQGYTTGDLVQVNDGAAGSLFTTVAGFINRLMSSSGAALVGYIHSAAAAVRRTAQDKLRDFVNVKDFGAVGDGVSDDTAALQAAIDYAWRYSKTLHLPAGTYLVTGLVLMGDSARQNTALKIIGEGFGNPFAMWTSAAGTVIKSVTDAPVFKVQVPTITTSAGTLDVSGVVFDGTSSTPVVYLQAFYGVGSFKGNCVLQRGTGHGLQIDWNTTGEISHVYILNKDWVSTGLGAARTGVGLYLSHVYDSGLQTIRKVSSRGFHTAYKIGVGGTGAWTYNASIENCECSVNYNGIHLTDNARSTVVNNCYFEGGDGGVAIIDDGDYNKVTKCFTFPGYSTHLKSLGFTYGNSYTENTFSAGSTPNQVLIDINSSSVSGGPGKTCSNNHLSFGGSGGGVAGVVGLRVSGTDPRLNLIGNNFYPRNTWVGGSGTRKLHDTSTGGVIGMTVVTGASGSQEIPMLSRGAISFELADTGLSQFNVTSNTLTVPEGSLFYCNASSAVTVNRLSTDGTAGRFLIFNTQNANMTFSNSAYMKLNGGVSFASQGHIVFYTQIISGTVYAYELCRSTY